MVDDRRLQFGGSLGDCGEPVPTRASLELVCPEMEPQEVAAHERPLARLDPRWHFVHELDDDVMDLGIIGVEAADGLATGVRLEGRHW